MGIDVRHVAGHNRVVAEVLDPRSLLSLALQNQHESSPILARVNPYAVTQVRSEELAALEAELSRLLRKWSSPKTLERAKGSQRRYALSLPETIRQDALRQIADLNLPSIQAHLEAVLALVSTAATSGARTSVRFYGD